MASHYVFSGRMWASAPTKAERSVSKSLAEFSPKAKRESKSIFRRGVYLAENSYQAASVEFVRYQRTNYARSRLQTIYQEEPKGSS